MISAKEHLLLALLRKAEQNFPRLFSTAEGIWDWINRNRMMDLVAVVQEPVPKPKKVARVEVPIEAIPPPLPESVKEEKKVPEPTKYPRR